MVLKKLSCFLSSHRYEYIGRTYDQRYIFECYKCKKIIYLRQSESIIIQNQLISGNPGLTYKLYYCPRCQKFSVYPSNITSNSCKHCYSIYEELIPRYSTRIPRVFFEFKGVRI